MAHPDAEVLAWASAVLDAEVTVLRGLRQGGSPWLLRAGDREVILRAARAGRAAETATEIAAMTCAARVPGAVLPVAATRPGATAQTPPRTSCAAGKPRRAGPRATYPTGTPSQRSPPRRTWAGSRYRWPFRVAPT